MMRYLAIAHHLPERTRLRSPVLRKDLPICERLADALAAVPGVREVKVRAYTGSVLIEHAADVAVSTLVEESRRVLACDKVLAIGESPPYDEQVPALSNLARTVVATFREIDRDIRRVSEGEVDLGTLTTLGMIGAGAAQVITNRKLQMPPWFNLAWWGFRTFVTAEQDEIGIETSQT